MAFIVAETTEESMPLQQMPLALKFGLSAQNVQVMKASFFDEDMGEDVQGDYLNSELWSHCMAFLLGLLFLYGSFIDI